MSNNKCWNVTTPQILWHGGSITEGKPDPVYSVDFHPKENVLLTTGIDASIPPRGSVRLWSIDAEQEKETFIVEFSDHSSVINIARFSPCGTMIASASHKQIIVYRVVEPFLWSQVKDLQEAKLLNLRQFEVKRFSPSVEDVVDLEWSPDSTYIIIGALEQKSEIIRISSRDKLRDNSLILPSHGGYVQGVAWDPYHQFVVTQSADRSVKVHKLVHRDSNAMVKLASNGHTSIKMYANHNENHKEDSANNSDWQAAETLTTATANVAAAAAESKKRTVGVNLFADSNVPSSFRRLSFSPDGSLLVVPTGVYRPAPPPATTSTSNSKNNSNTATSSNKDMTFCTHLFLRNHFQYPAISLVGLEDPSVAVRFCPRLFQLLPDTSSSLFAGSYRMIFCVTTISCVLLYDTQHPYPLAKLKRLHFAPINDAAWSADGRVLVVCSSDGYLSFIRFKEGALGEVLEAEKVPQVVKRSHPALYGMTVNSSSGGNGSNEKETELMGETPRSSVNTAQEVMEEEEKMEASPHNDHRMTNREEDREEEEEHPVVESEHNHHNNKSTSSNKKRHRITPEKLDGLSLQDFSLIPPSLLRNDSN